MRVLCKMCCELAQGHGSAEVLAGTVEDVLFKAVPEERHSEGSQELVEDDELRFAVFFHECAVGLGLVEGLSHFIEELDVDAVILELGVSLLYLFPRCGLIVQVEEAGQVHSLVLQLEPARLDEVAVEQPSVQQQEGSIVRIDPAALTAIEVVPDECPVLPCLPFFPSRTLCLHRLDVLPKVVLGKRVDEHDQVAIKLIVLVDVEVFLLVCLPPKDQSALSEGPDFLHSFLVSYLHRQ